MMGGMSTKKPPKNAQPCEIAGVTYWFSELTPGLRKLFSSVVRSRARQNLIDDKPYLSDEAYAAEWDNLQHRIDGGAYEWGPPVELGGTGQGKAIQAALDYTEGNLLLVQMLLAEAHGELPLQQVAELLSKEKGNPEGITAAIRAGMGLPPFVEKQSEENEKEKPESNPGKASPTPIAETPSVPTAAA